MITFSFRPRSLSTLPEIAAELGLAGEGFNGGYGQEFDADLASLEKIGAGGTDPGFVEELADLEIPEEPTEE